MNRRHGQPNICKFSIIIKKDLLKKFYQKKKKMYQRNPQHGLTSYGLRVYMKIVTACQDHLAVCLHRPPTFDSSALAIGPSNKTNLIAI